jgi:hypothetical protein
LEQIVRRKVVFLFAELAEERGKAQIAAKKTSTLSPQVLIGIKDVLFWECAARCRLLCVGYG